MRAIVLATIVMTFLLINLGGYVHNTGSSLACPDWPLCYGQVMPKMEGGILIEHSHRMLASLVGFFTILLVFFLHRSKQNKKIIAFGYVLLGLVVFQGLLGGLTVIYKLPSFISTGHLATSMIYFASLLLMAFKLFPSEVKAKFSSSQNSWSLAVVLLVYLQMIVGALMRHLGLGGACGVGYENSLLCFDMIEFSKGWLPVSSQAQIHAFHRYFAVIVSLVVFYSSLKNFKTDKRLSFLTPLLIVLFQVLLGIMTIGTNLGEVVTTLHLAGATLLLGNLWYNYLVVSSNQENKQKSQWMSKIKDYLSLTKPRLSGLVIFTAGIGMYLAPGEISVMKVMISMIATSLVVAGACVINCYIEREIDRLMPRTANRPLPSRRISEKGALSFGVFLNVASLLVIYKYVNITTAWLGLVATILYVFLYTPLKRKTPLAVFVGAIPGAIPPLMGWTTVTDEASGFGLVLFSLLFIWQLPHFLSISVFYSKDYGSAGIKVYPNTQGIHATKLWIVFYTALLFITSLVPYSFGYSSVKYVSLVMVLGFVFCLFALSGLLVTEENSKSQVWAKKYFWGSLIYLPAIMSGLILFK